MLIFMDYDSLSKKSLIPIVFAYFTWFHHTDKQVLKSSAIYIEMQCVVIWQLLCKFL